jgi:valyl-tRNA synthetase
VWSWWQEGSVHRSSWPTVDELGDLTAAEPHLLDVAATALGEIRKAKTEAKRSLRTPVERVDITGTGELLHALDQVRRDVVEAGVVADLVTTADPSAVELRVTATLAPAEQ